MKGKGKGYGPKMGDSMKKGESRKGTKDQKSVMLNKAKGGKSSKTPKAKY